MAILAKNSPFRHTPFNVRQSSNRIHGQCAYILSHVYGEFGPDSHSPHVFRNMFLTTFLMNTAHSILPYGFTADRFPDSEKAISDGYRPDDLSHRIQSVEHYVQMTTDSISNANLADERGHLEVWRELVNDTGATLQHWLYRRGDEYNKQTAEIADTIGQYLIADGIDEYLAFGWFPETLIRMAHQPVDEPDPVLALKTSISCSYSL